MERRERPRLTLHDVYGDKYRQGGKTLHNAGEIIAEMRARHLESLAAQLRTLCADPDRLARLRRHLVNDNPLKPFMGQSE